VVNYSGEGAYDAAGNLKHYTMWDRDAAAINTYDYTLARFEGYKESVVARHQLRRQRLPDQGRRQDKDLNDRHDPPIRQQGIAREPPPQ
jgi:hypothetical protein